MLTQAAHAIQLNHQPDIILPLRGERADETSGLGALGVVMSVIAAYILSLRDGAKP
jgi:hypothetical protein